jgi:hypothetical protein
MTVTATDTDGATSTDMASIDVRNFTPTLTLTTTSIYENIPEDTSASLELVLTDHGISDTHHLEIDWGDHGANTFSDVAASGVAVTKTGVYEHQYKDNGDFSFLAIVRDDADAIALFRFLITVKSVAPTATIEAVVDSLKNAVGEFADVNVVNLGLPVVESVTFQDVGTLDTHTALVAWGDGETTNETVTSPVEWSHTYAVSGNYSMEITIFDDDSDSVVLSQVFYVLDPTDAVFESVISLKAIAEDEATSPELREVIFKAQKALGYDEKKRHLKERVVGARHKLMDGKGKEVIKDIGYAIKKTRGR